MGAGSRDRASSAAEAGPLFIRGRPGPSPGRSGACKLCGTRVDCTEPLQRVLPNPIVQKTRPVLAGGLEVGAGGCPLVIDCAAWVIKPAGEAHAREQQRSLNKRPCASVHQRIEVALTLHSLWAG